MNVLESVAVLSDEQAVRALTLLLAYQGQIPPEDERPRLESQMLSLAADPVIAEYHGTSAATEGELARAALSVLALSTQLEPAVIDEALALATRPDRSGLEVIGILSAVSVVLQSEVKLERGSDGVWHFLVHKRPARDSTVGQLLGKLVGYFTGSR